MRVKLIGEVMAFKVTYDGRALRMPLSVFVTIDELEQRCVEPRFVESEILLADRDGFGRGLRRSDDQLVGPPP